ncbi:hypothetical protein [Lacinutrix sp. Hel_I_90]|uniref:hypothetical protein n=1 Tax=Lacinutrix sp. Hel_I_90 TaxID=1249999 RepID=UPI0005C96D7A|nr:hypothetical protein [Lacinutrix sp. Hel_I_90]
MLSNFQDLANELELTLGTISNFKIGKTEQNIADCYHGQYAHKYSNYKIITYSKSLETITAFETYLIQRFKNLKACDNKAINHTKLAVAARYILYLMYND